MEFIDPALLAYCESITSSEDALLKKITRETQAKVLMPRMISGHLQGKMLELFAKMLQPKTDEELPPFPSYIQAVLHMLRSLTNPRIGAQWHNELKPS